MLSEQCDAGHLALAGFSLARPPFVPAGDSAEVGYSSPPWLSRSASGRSARKYPSFPSAADAMPYDRECTTETARLNASRSAPASDAGASDSSFRNHVWTASRISRASATAGGYCSDDTSSSVYSSGEPGTESGRSATYGAKVESDPLVRSCRSRHASRTPHGALDMTSHVSGGWPSW